ncbi:MAG: RtcB family protein [Desulfovibrionaceae bacterium]|nr:RtcB family protein [Desulfovibrionaceae bacterium]
MLRPQRETDHVWRIPRNGEMRVDGVIYADRALVEAMDARVFEQVANVACLPGIVGASYAMPDAHSGYGFPIGGVAAFDPREGGVVSAGGVGFDIACGVRTLTTGVAADDVRAVAKELADELFRNVPSGLGSTGPLHLGPRDMDRMLEGGAAWAVKAGWGHPEDLERIEDNGRMDGARPDLVPDSAKKRQERETGTLGSGNHYLEVQEIARIHDPAAARALGLRPGEAVVSIHCGSRGLGHEIGKVFLGLMAREAPRHGLRPPDRELACAPALSELGRRYLGAMRAGINCALANRQVITHLARLAFDAVLPGSLLRLVYDVSHNTCKEERHVVDGQERTLLVHRKGATRALPPGHPLLPPDLRALGQPVLVGGSMGTPSHILAATPDATTRAFGSANHGAGRALSRTAAKKRFAGPDVLRALAAQGVTVRTGSYAAAAEEAPGAYKDPDAVVDVVERLGLARRVAELRPMVCVKG